MIMNIDSNTLLYLYFPIGAKTTPISLGSQSY